MYERLGAHYDEPRILDLIVSKNMARRQLNPGQRALMALEYEKHYAAAQPKGRPIGGLSVKHVPAADECSTPTKATATESKKTPRDPEELGASRLSRESAARAASVVGASRDAVHRAKAIVRDAPDLAEKVRRGELALDRAFLPKQQALLALRRRAVQDYAHGLSELGMSDHQLIGPISVP